MPFTPWPSLIGGLMLSVSTSSVLSLDGRVLGISGITHGVVQSAVSPSSSGDTRKLTWRHAAFAGLLAGGAILGLNQLSFARLVGAPIFDAPLTSFSTSRAALAGLLVGFGTKLGSGCTSGHMLCGMSRFSRRSITAVVTFFATAVVTARLLPAPFPASTASHTASNLLSPASSLSISAIALLQLPALLAWLPLPSPLDTDLVSSFFLSVHFALGLALAGMLRPSKVISFFYFPFLASATTAGSRAWDPSLAMVALGGLIPNAVAYHTRIKKMTKPKRETAKWELPTQSRVDARLVLGAAVFGIGWGLMGICPGPLIASLGAGQDLAHFGPFAAAFAVGGLVAQKV